MKSGGTNLLDKKQEVKIKDRILINRDFSKIAEREDRRYNSLPFYLSLSLYFVFCAVFFLRQIALNNSDFTPHVNFMMYDTYSYSFMHKSGKLLSNLFIYLFPKIHPNIIYIKTFAVITALANALSMYLIRIILIRLYKPAGSVARYITDVLSVSVMFVSMIYPFPPLFSTGWYIGIGTPNPWHNPTFVFSRPFAIMVLIFFFGFVSAIQERRNWLKEVIMFSISLFFCMWSKPSFLVAFFPALFIYIIWKLAISRGGFVKETSIIVIALLPAVINFFLMNILLVHYGTGSNNFIFNPGAVISIYVKNIPMGLFFGAAFPIFVCLAVIFKKFERKEKVDEKTSFVFLVFIMAYMLYFLFSQKGNMAAYADLSWTYMFGLFFGFAIGAGELFLSRSYGPIPKAAGLVLFGAHLVTGTVYLQKIFELKSTIWPF